MFNFSRAAIGAGIYALTVSGSLAHAQSTSAAVETAVEEEMVCKRIAQAGTRVKKRVCHTKSMWEKMAVKSQEMMQEVKDVGGQSGATF
ncbi:MAG: hypothetical protein AAF205_05690 [Pseudomonadota bacterium]